MREVVEVELDPAMVRLARTEPRLRFLDQPVLHAAAVFPPDRRPRPTTPSTLDDPVVLRLATTEW